MAKRERPPSAPRPAGGGGSLCASIAAMSDVGLVRAENEDSYLIFDLQKKTALAAEQPVRLPLARPGLLLAVADGMGGHSAGQVASRLCVDTLPAELLKSLGEGATPPASPSAALQKAVEATNDAVHNAAQRNPAQRGMGTTLTAAWVAGPQAAVAQVGDSRAYHLRSGQLTQLTRDQTVLNSVSEAERESLLNTPFESMLLQAVGPLPYIEVALTTTPLAAGDSLLLCSDGLTRVLSAEQIAQVLQDTATPQEKVEALVRQANEAGGPDNVTVILCEVRRSQSQ